MLTDLKDFLEKKVDAFNRPKFISQDPISIPHQFSSLQDIEIIGFWIAMLSWGQRKTILNKGAELIELMDGQPYDFVLNHQEKDRQRFAHFKHRTFNYTDTLYFLSFFQQYYRHHNSLEDAFVRHLSPDDATIKTALIGFHDSFFALDYAPQRTRKHVATPARKSRCKRLNMFLRWMVRKDEHGVDFGLWHQINPAQLMMPLDLHVERVARQLGLLQRKQTDWLAVEELTSALRQFDPTDPVKYDFALFGMSIEASSSNPKS